MANLNEPTTAAFRYYHSWDWSGIIRGWIAGAPTQLVCVHADHLHKLAESIDCIARERDAAIERAERAEARSEELQGALQDAAEEIESWGAYASSYFQEKHDLDGCVEKFETVAKGARYERR